MGEVLDNFSKLKQKINPASYDAVSHNQTIIQVGSATCEKAAGSDGVRDEFEKLIKASGRNDIVIKQTGCTGRCSQEPIVGVFVPHERSVKYQQVTPEIVSKIFQEHVLGGKPITTQMLDKTTENLYSHVVSFASEPTATKEAVSWVNLFKEKIRAKGISEESLKIQSSGGYALSPLTENGQFAVFMVFPENVIYRVKTEQEMDEVIESQFVKNEVIGKHIVHTEHLTEEFFRVYGDISFFNKQTRITLRNCGIIDPESLADYLHADGYKALADILSKNDGDFVVREVLKSGLRGRGGGGFPTGMKWKSAREATSPDGIKYVICNADEGDPGAFMDRSALEGDPFSVIEGMTIGGFAMGATKGYLYIRAEYPLAIKRIDLAIKTAREQNLLGKNILGSGFDFDLEIRLGAGAFVCGEETALIHSIEGKRGQPRMRPPFPSISGLWDRPTCINNVETWANIPVIFLYGSTWFSSIGTEKSKGTKVFALAGKVTNTGLVEVPMGTTLRDVIYNIGGGVPGGKQLKAVQTGGPSGGFIPSKLIDTTVDFESLKAIGSIMGSGGMIVLDDADCMVNTAKFFLEFTHDESCGKCLPCREGTLRMLEILRRITEGHGEMEDIDKLDRLGRMIKRTSLCGLGQSAPNPVLSMIEHFREELEIHILEKRCPTQKCTKLITYRIQPDKCTGCTLCARRCPVLCIHGERKKAHSIVQDYCIKCGECYHNCKFNAIEKI